MKRRGLITTAAVTLCSVLVAGCSGQTQAETAADVPVSSESLQDTGTQNENGVVSLTVWAEETNHEVLGKMIESFKQEYAGQAEFDIQIVTSADAETRGRVLGDIHNAADVFTLADDQLSSLAAGGALAKVPNAEEIKAANLEGAVEAASIGDTLYAYPMSADNGFFLYYDKTYFTEEDVQSLD
ncbi:MAG: extracellular solute-binding protein, partial [Lachnospiraceae bacterium]|nr:extracellular solute-binding protein [Lachnospiraceae bacterium]